jgi:hypothetical protein
VDERDYVNHRPKAGWRPSMHSEIGSKLFRYSKPTRGESIRHNVMMPIFLVGLSCAIGLSPTGAHADPGAAARAANRAAIDATLQSVRDQVRRETRQHGAKKNGCRVTRGRASPAHGYLRCNRPVGPEAVW